MTYVKLAHNITYMDTHAVTVYTNKERIDALELRIHELEKAILQLVKNDQLTRRSLQELKLDTLPEED